MPYSLHAAGFVFSATQQYEYEFQRNMTALIFEFADQEAE
jgi:hypothetical protein